MLILIVHGLINVFSSPPGGAVQPLSVWWHVLGVAAIVVILIAVPTITRASPSCSAIGQQLRLQPSMYWFYVLPVGFLLTMYTFTGYDASAHISEETHDATSRRRKGCGARSSTRPSSAGSCCSRSCSRRPTSTRSPAPAARRSPIIETALSSAAAKA